MRTLHFSFEKVTCALRLNYQRKTWSFGH